MEPRPDDEGGSRFGIGHVRCFLRDSNSLNALSSPANSVDSKVDMVVQQCMVCRCGNARFVPSELFAAKVELETSVVCHDRRWNRLCLHANCGEVVRAALGLS